MMYQLLISKPEVRMNFINTVIHWLFNYRLIILGGNCTIGKLKKHLEVIFTMNIITITSLIPLVWRYYPL